MCAIYVHGVRRGGPRQLAYLGVVFGKSYALSRRPTARVVLERDHYGGNSMRCAVAILTLSLGVAGCRLPGRQNLPPAVQLMHPGPGVDGPGPGVMMAGTDGAGSAFMARSSQVVFADPEGMIVNWDAIQPGQFDSEPLVVPGRYNFPQGAIYRLKLTNIPARPGLELYPTLEIGPTVPRTDAYLSHNAIPVQFTEEDFDQVTTGNFVTKVIYLPDAEYQELAIAGVETLVSTRLDPGIDPIVEADRRGAILAIVRIGNKDLAVTGGDASLSGDVMHAAYCAPGGEPISLPGNVAGVTAPQYGMPMCGTPIGLPGPPHVPLGGPAGLQKHSIFNKTHYQIPNPTKAIKMHVKQTPGFQYPHPPSRVFIHEKTVAPWGAFHRPLSDQVEHVQ